MKISYSIFLAGIVIIALEIMLVQANASDELSLLYFFIIIILFFCGGIIYFIERGIEGDPLGEYTKKSEKRSTKTLQEYKEKPKKRLTKKDPLL